MGEKARMSILPAVADSLKQTTVFKALINALKNYDKFLQLLTTIMGPVAECIATEYAAKANGPQ